MDDLNPKCSSSYPNHEAPSILTPPVSELANLYFCYPTKKFSCHGFLSQNHKIVINVMFFCPKFTN